MNGKDLEGRIKDLLGDKKEIEIRKGLSICRPSKELDLLQIREGNMNYYLELCNSTILGEVIDYVYAKKPEPEEEIEIFPDDYPDDLPNDSPFKKKKKDLGEDPLKDNIFIPD